VLNGSYTPGSYQIFMAGTACARLPKPSERHDMVPECVAVRDACNAIPNVADQDARTDKTRAVHPKFLAPGGQATFMIYAHCPPPVKA